MNTIENIQAGFAQEAEKVAKATSEKAAGDNGGEQGQNSPENKDNKQDGNNKDGKQGEGSPGENEISLAKFLKEKHGLDLTDDEILERLKGNGQSNNNGHQAASVPAPVKPPKIEDITDDDVVTILEKSGRTRDLLSKAKDYKGKDDLTIVRDHYVAMLKDQHKLTDQDALDLFNERYFIPPPEQADAYTDAEKKVGESLIKQEADRLRGQVDYVIDSVRNTALQEKEKEFEKNNFTSTVETFLSKAKKNFAIPIGKSGALDLGEFPFNVNDDAFQRISQTMKDPASFANRFKNDDDVFDLQKFYDFLVKVETLEDTNKSMAVYYHSKGVDSVENKLNNDPDLTNVGKETADKRNKTAAEIKKDTEEYNRKQIEANLDRHKRASK